MIVDLKKLTHRLTKEIGEYVVPLSHPRQLGTPLPSEWFEAGLAEMRAAVVEPYLLDVSDHYIHPGEVLSRTVTIVADDAGFTSLAFDPNPDGDFALVWRLENEIALSNIRGDAVGCFLSR